MKKKVDVTDVVNIVRFLGIDDTYIKSLDPMDTGDELVFTKTDNILSVTRRSIDGVKGTLRWPIHSSGRIDTVIIAIRFGWEQEALWR